VNHSSSIRTRNPEQTLDRLIEAALDLFGQYGYERTTIDKIVRQAGYSKGAFYNHFGSKEELFIYLLEQRVKNNQQRIQTLYGQETHPGKWLRSLVASLLQTTHANKQWAALSIEFMVQGMRDERLGNRLAILHQDWRRLIADKLRRSEAYQAGRMAANPDAVAAVVVAMLDGFIIQASMEPNLLTTAQIDQYVEQLVGIVEET
jgi:TetR/AcrR family fatty acid metabolism transcriptional regulator